MRLHDGLGNASGPLGDSHVGQFVRLEGLQNERFNGSFGRLEASGGSDRRAEVFSLLTGKVMQFKVGNVVGVFVEPELSVPRAAEAEGARGSPSAANLSLCVSSLVRALAHKDKLAALGDPRAPGRLLDYQLFCAGGTQMEGPDPREEYVSAEGFARLRWSDVVQYPRHLRSQQTGETAMCTTVAGAAVLLARFGGAPAPEPFTSAPYFAPDLPQRYWSFGLEGMWLEKMPAEVYQSLGEVQGWVTPTELDTSGYLSDRNEG